MRTLMRGLSVIGFTALLAACASSPSTISLIPDKTTAITSKDGVFTQPLVIEQSRPGCKGTCPSIEINSLIFPGHKALTNYVDQQLADMTQFDGSYQPHQTVESFIHSFWSQAAPRDQVVLSTKIRYSNQYLTVLELTAWQYITGAAHGMGEVRFINWDNRTNKPILFDQMIAPNKVGAFLHELEQAHAKWLETQEAAIEDIDAYLRIWPFQPSDNIALTDAGIVVKYNSYEIAPYSSGQPELLIPYPQLKGILPPALLPN